MSRSATVDFGSHRCGRAAPTRFPHVGWMTSADRSPGSRVLAPFRLPGLLAQWHVEGTTRLQLREQLRNWQLNQCLTVFPNGPTDLDRAVCTWFHQRRGFTKSQL